MIIVVGLVLLVAAVIVAVTGVMTNGGGAHALTDHFAVFGYHITGSTGTLFLYGIVVGAMGLFGLSLLFAGARRTARRGRLARRELKDSRRDTALVSRDRDDLVEAQQRGSAHADGAAAAGAPSVGTDGAEHRRPVAGRGRLHRFGRRSADQQSVGASPGDGRA
jgi:uncharacterized membrane protein YciS (DUF1049 family)